MPRETEGEWEPTVTLTVPRETLTDGRGHTANDDRDLFVIHGVLLHTGKILLFCGHTELLFYAPVSYVFDPVTATLQRVPFPPDTDLFCCHYVQLADGRILAVGGSQLDSWGFLGLGSREYHGSNGAKNLLTFDPITQRWEKTGDELDQGRWYPTAVLLGDGRVIVVSGRREFGVPFPAIADKVEVMEPPCYTPRELEGARVTLPIYPGLHLAPDGRVFFTHTNWGQEIDDPGTMALTISGNNGTWDRFGGAVRPHRPRREEGMSVPLPTRRTPSTRGRILVVGGSQAMDAAGRILRKVGAPTDRFHHVFDRDDALSAEILDTTQNPPRWTAVGPTRKPRINGHCVLLPDQSVLILGGHDMYKWRARANAPPDAGPVTEPSLEVEFFREGPPPTFVPGARMERPRMYHSVALLLNDGRVFVAGGADPNDFEPAVVFGDDWEGREYTGGRFGVPPDQPRRNGQGGVTLNRKDYQIFNPPYCFGPRPAIESVNKVLVDYGESLVITSPHAADISHVALMRPGAVTHHTDSEQRYVEVAFTRSGDNLLVTMPAATDKSVAPPGYYMIWIIEGENRPCQRAFFVRLGPGTGACNRGWPCAVATVAYGSPDAPEVAYLRSLRAELAATTPGGRWFVRVVNGVYYSFSPRLAATLAEHPRARLAVRDGAVRPAVASIRAAERLARRVPAVALSQAVLMLLLVLLSLVAVAATPIWLAVLAGLLLRRREEATDGG